jgi:hypothetical protein
MIIASAAPARRNAGGYKTLANDGRHDRAIARAQARVSIGLFLNVHKIRVDSDNKR